MESYIEQPYRVFIRHDAQNRITAVHSDAFLTDTEGWTEIDSGLGDRYHHAQGNYFDQPIMDERGVWRYLYTPDAENLWRERTSEEMDADLEEQGQPALTLEERVTVLEEKVNVEMSDQQAALNLLGVYV